MRHLFIVNPAAGKKDFTEKVQEHCRTAFANAPDRFEIYRTRAPKDAITKVKAECSMAQKTGEELRIYACGGDGTLNECVNGAANMPLCAVTHFPTGTGNDFLRTFGEEKELFRDLSNLTFGEVRPLDLIECNGRYSIAVCSVGLDARIGTRVHKYTKAPFIGNKAGYVISLGANFIEGITDDMKISVNDYKIEGNVNLACVCNGTSYGGGFTPVPEARPDDGILDVLVAHNVTRPKLLGVVLDYAKGQYAKHPDYIHHERTDKVVIDCPYELDINLDGELMKDKHVEMKLCKGAVNFIFPRGMKYFKD